MIIATLFLSLLGSIIAKFFFLNINKYEFLDIFKDEFSQQSKRYLLLPIYNIKLLQQLVLKSKLTKSKYQKLLKLSLLSEVLGAVVFAIFSLGLQTTSTTLAGFSLVIYIIVIIGFLGALLYLAVFDLVTFTIPEVFIKYLTLIAIIANLVIGLVRIVAANFGYSIFKNIPLGNIDNLLAGLVLAGLLWLIVKVTKEKGMGEGDVYLVLIIGLILGWPNTLTSFLATLIVGSIISVLVALYFKRFKDLIVPFVPFLLLGFVIAFVFGHEIYSKLFFL